MVRASALRVTGLTSKGVVPSPYPMAASRSVIRVTIDEVTDAKATETEDADNGRARIKIPGDEQVVGYVLDIEFIRVDPGLISLLTQVPQVLNHSGDVVGFDADTRLPVATLALEVWSRLDRQSTYGYTIFPMLKGGRISGVKFDGGLASFTVLGARTQTAPRWGRGPYDVLGPGQPLEAPVSRNTAWTTTVTTLPPPEQTDGIVYVTPPLPADWEGGTAAETTDDILDGEFVVTSSDDVDGGQAA